ncbi:Fpg/Nei family DNA glycosylase [Paenarthrobacter sp. Z7-10]|uniref:DNA-formamidopyrimidine glycosylase family protein n=1 Tax=Paenarthrobacter sp. Z7-10 TaxID=2787635 RepID=UPI0022A927A2|nr:DNA-formamidopyrimidine glycosylase family protein [Paenarthrobacter sp. Z7-10]MCZ2402825.1 Fpg/Nei family DNA glycosylase [Paenarthrobacter sp. Z7-10]
MPEGDNVWRDAKLLGAALTGRQLVRCDIRVPKYATVDFSGSMVDAVRSRGKHLLISVAGHLIHSHLKMEGVWHVYPGGPRSPQKWRRPAYTARCILGTDAATAVGFSLGLLEVLTPEQEREAVGHLGPDLLGADWDAAEAVRRLAAQPGRSIGTALLDQRNLAGIGNIYRNELCFLAGVHPAATVQQVQKLERLERIVDTAKRLLEANKDRPRSTTGLPARGDAAVWVYRREGKPCKRCGTYIRHGTLGESLRPGQAEQRLRDIYFCPRCQPPRD